MQEHIVGLSNHDVKGKVEENAPAIIVSC